MKSLFKPLLATALIFFATSANADLIIELSDTSDFSGGLISISDATDATGMNDGIVVIMGGIGDWIVNVVTGTSSPLIGDAYVDKLDLASVNVSGGAGTIFIRLTDTDFDRGAARYITAFGGTTDGTTSFQSYVDSTNAEFGQGLLLSDSGDLSGAFSGTDSGGFDMTGPYSMSIFASITHTGAGQISSFDYIVKVPEPSTIVLLGIGLLVMGASRRKRGQAVR